MAAVKDTYTLELLDKILAPLKRIEAQAEKVGGVMERLEKMASSGLGMAKLVGAIGGAALGLGALGSAMSTVLGHLTKLTAGFGSGIIAAASFRERYLTMFSHRFGAEAGKGLYNSVLDFSQVTPGTAAELAENTARFANIGMKGKDLAAAVAAGADVQAMFGGEAGAKFGRGLTDMWSKQHLEMQDFKQSLSGVVGFDVAQAAILRLKGIKVSAEKVGETFDKLHKKGKITGREGAVGALMAVQEGPNKGKALGSFAVERGQGSLEGLISNIGEAWENLQRKVAFEDLPGMVALKDFLKRLLVYFDAATPQGRQLVAVVEKLTNTLFGGLAKIQDDDLARFFESALKVAEKFTETIKSAWEWLDQMLHGDTSGMVAATGKAMLEVGKLIGQGVWEGFKLAFQGKEEAESKKRGGMTEGQYGALGKELGGAGGARGRDHAGDHPPRWRRRGPRHARAHRVPGQARRPARGPRWPGAGRQGALQPRRLPGYGPRQGGRAGRRSAGDHGEGRRRRGRGHGGRRAQEAAQPQPKSEHGRRRRRCGRRPGAGHPPPHRPDARRRGR